MLWNAVFVPQNWSVFLDHEPRTLVEVWHRWGWEVYNAHPVGWADDAHDPPRFNWLYVDSLPSRESGWTIAQTSNRNTLVLLRRWPSRSARVIANYKRAAGRRFAQGVARRVLLDASPELPDVCVDLVVGFLDPGPELDVNRVPTTVVTHAHKWSQRKHDGPPLARGAHAVVGDGGSMV
jgi:hypothetical protein